MNRDLVNAAIRAHSEVVKLQEIHDRNELALDMRTAEVVAAREARDHSRRMLRDALKVLSDCVLAIANEGSKEG